MIRILSCVHFAYFGSMVIGSIPGSGRARGRDDMKVLINETVQAPIDAVFDLMSDISNAEKHIDGITKVEVLSDIKSGKGLR